MSQLRLLVGDVRKRLRDLPDDYFHVACTSPPYWGLRQYSTIPQVWGETDSSCEHLWATEAEHHEERELTVHGKTRTSDRAYGGDASRRFDGNHQKHVQAEICSRCGAMRCELGHEPLVSQYVAHLVEVCQEIRRVLRPDGQFYLNLGDSYASAWPCQRRSIVGQGSLEDGRRGNRPPRLGDGLKEKDLVMMPARVALALQDDGWYLCNDIIWHRKNAKPESVRDRFSMDYEHVFLLTRSSKYYADMHAVREPHTTPLKDQARQRNTRGKQAYAGAMVGQPQQDSYAGLGFGAGGRNRRSVWTLNTKPYKGAHFACFPEELPEICLRASTSEGGCCSECGAPRERVTVKGAPDREWQTACGGDAEGQYDGQAQKDYVSANAENASDVKRRILEGMRPSITIGWKPRCACCQVCDGEVEPTEADTGALQGPGKEASVFKASVVEKFREAKKASSEEGTLQESLVELRTLSGELHGRDGQSSVLFNHVCREVGDGEQAKAPTSPIRGEDGRRTGRICEDLQTRPSDGDEERIYRYSSVCDVGASGKASVADGGCSSQERRSPRQSDRELGLDDEGRTCPASLKAGCAHPIVRYPTVSCRALDPFAGTGTTLAVAHTLHLDAVGVELQPDFVPLAENRVEKAGGFLVVDRAFGPVPLAPVVESPIPEACRGSFEERACWEVLDGWLKEQIPPLQVPDAEPEWPEISDLIAAATVSLALLREVEWELEAREDEESGWPEDQVFEGFSWSRASETDKMLQKV